MSADDPNNPVRDFILQQPTQPSEEDSFMDYIKTVDAEMMRRYRIDTSDAGVEMDMLASCQEEGWTPQDFVKWFGEHYDLTPVQEHCVTCPGCEHRFVYEAEPEVCMGAVKCPQCAKVLTQEARKPWSGVAWHGKRISRSPTYDDRSEAEKWLATQRRRFHPKHWMRSTLLKQGLLHHINANQRGLKRISAQKVVENLIG